MIHIDEQPAPADFAKRVSNKGARFLAQVPSPNSDQWKKNDHWKDVIPDLYDSYSGVCAYCCHWIPRDTGIASVEHFQPKSKFPQRAYDWSNYRLVASRLNSRKLDFDDVLDPFTLMNGWFTLMFPEMLIRPDPALTDAEKEKVIATVDRLKLNDEICIKSRLDWLKGYCEGIPIDYLEKRAPFIALELKRQNLVDSVCERLNA